MPKLIRMYIRNVLIGFGVAGLFVALLLALDVMGLRHLTSGSDVGILAVVILWFAHGIVFAGVQFGWAVMAMREKQTPPRRGSPVLGEMQPVPATARKAPRKSR